MDNLTARVPADDLIHIFQPEKHEDLVLFGAHAGKARSGEVCMLAKLLGEPSREALVKFRHFKLLETLEGATRKRLLIASKTY